MKIKCGGTELNLVKVKLLLLKDQSQFTVQKRSVLRKFGLANYFGFRYKYSLLPA